MPHVVGHIALRVFGFTLGTALLLSSVLLYEDEEGRIQSVLADAWQRSKDVRAASTKSWMHFIVSAASLTDQTLTAMFGSALTSRRFVLVSAACPS